MSSSETSPVSEIILGTLATASRFNLVALLGEIAIVHGLIRAILPRPRSC